MKTLTKYEFKICEAVHLGLEHYYMGKNDIRKVTDEDKKLANRIIPTLPDKWWLKKYGWMSVRH